MLQAHIITGQTATGKTQVALNMAKEKGGYLVSADSRQIYSEMDIITGKDIGLDDHYSHIKSITLSTDKDVKLGFYLHNGVMIWGFDCIAPNEQFSAYEYACVFQEIVSNTIVKDMIPIVVGGSYLYIRALLDGLDTIAAPSWELRASLETATIPELQSQLENLDATMFYGLNNSDRNNPHRLIRKIEIASNPKMDDSQSLQPLIQPLSYLGLMHSSQESMQRLIAQRIQSRIQAGALEEVKMLISKGYTADSPGLKTLGYKDILHFIAGDISWNDAVEKWLISEVQYAKRQKTFMKKDPRITWQTI